MFHKVIVKQPSESYFKGLTTANLGLPSTVETKRQHESYRKAMELCGVELINLPADEDYPDSVFVEDTAVVTNKFAVVSRPGAPTRTAEAKLMEPTLKKYFEHIHSIEAPGTLEGGDILQIDNTFFIGISKRTNAEGAKQLKRIVEEYGHHVILVPHTQFFHLKTGITYIGDNTVLAAGEFIGHKAFKDFACIPVPPEEEYACNAVQMNGKVLFPKGYPKTKQALIHSGFDLIEIEMSEFKKQDGGLTCLSLRF